MNWWLIIRVPDALYAVPAWAEGQPADEAFINACRAAAGFPADDAWAFDGSAHDLQLTLGDPHPSILAAATPLDVAKVNPAAAAEHAAARIAAVQEDRVDSARAVLASLGHVQLAQVLESLNAGTA